MPVIRVSNEAYRTLLRLQAEDGNTMSIFLDRFFAEHDKTLKPVVAVKPKAKTTKKPIKKPKAKKLTAEERKRIRVEKQVNETFRKNFLSKRA